MFSNFEKRHISAVAMAAMLASTAPGNAQSNFVELESIDGSALVAGNLVEFNDEFYIVSTEIGELRVSASRMVCRGEACPEIDKINAAVTLAGSDTLAQGLMPLVFQGYANTLGAEASTRNGSVAGQTYVETVADSGFGEDLSSYLIVSNSSSEAFEALRDKTADIALSSRRITRDEAKALRAAGAGNMVSPESERVVAVDSLVVIVHPDNPLSVLSIADIADIYAGRITNWQQLGGPDSPINALLYDEGSASRAIFERTLSADQGLNFAGGLSIAGDDDEMAALVNRDPNAIGFVGFAFQRGAKALNIANECGMEIAPTRFSAKAEEYPMSRRLYLYSRDDTVSDEAVDILNFAQSELADGVIAKAGFIDLGIESQAQDFLIERLQNNIAASSDDFEIRNMSNLMTEMAEWDRLSTTIRFPTASSQLDQKAQNDVGRLVSHLQNYPAGTEVAIVGFTDSVGPFSNNLALSFDRAEQVAVEVQNAIGDSLENVNFVVKGFGEMSPVSCNTNEAGRAINRRVEAWIKVPE